MKVQVKKKLVQNFEFDPKDVKIEKECIKSYKLQMKQLKAEIFCSTSCSHQNDSAWTILRAKQNMNDFYDKVLLSCNKVSILKELNGNYVVKCHKILKSKTHVYLVYDHCSKKTLNDIIRINQEIIKMEGKIDSRAAAKLQENHIDLQIILHFAKQLYQILTQIQSKNIVHVRFYPQNLILQKNGMFKLSNFSHVQLIKNKQNQTFTELPEHNEFTDPYSKQTNKIGFFTDIYSYGVIMQKLYDIFKFSQKFQPNKQLENFIQKLKKQNPQQRAKQKQILDFLIDIKKNSEISKKRSKDQVIQKSSRTKIQDGSKQQLSTCRSLKSMTYRHSSTRTTQQEISTKGQIFYLRSSDLKNRQTRRKNSDSFKTSLSRNKTNNSLSSNSQTTKNQLPSELSKEITDFSQIKNKIFMKRHQSMLLLQIANIIANQIKGQNMFTLQLTYLLYKKSMIEFVYLAKYLSKGSPKYISDISESLRLKFIKTSDYYQLCKTINDQLQEQRNVMSNISTIIKKQFHGVIFNGENTQFQKQLKFQALSNQFFVKTIKRYLESFVQDFMVFNTNTKDSRKIFFYLNILLQMLKSKSYENFIVQNFQKISIKSQKETDKKQNKRIFQVNLQNNTLFQKLKQSNCNELSENLVGYFKMRKN